MNTQNPTPEPNNENRITKIIHGLKNAFSWCRENADKKPKMRTKTGTDDYYISYILNSKTD